ncbi:MAG: N-acetyl-gamma-glutamyl-phosphate reductase [Candidatus Methylomirabilia bacterium]
MVHEVGIIGASGYTGGELLRLLCRHPSLQVGWATSRQHAGLPAGEVFTSLRDFTKVVFSAPDLARLPAGVEAVFVALPHVEAMSVVPGLLERGLKVVDLSADFRLRDAAVYSAAYGNPHAAPGLLAEAVYGLTEHTRARVREARLVANPGCYPTATLLALLPLAHRGLLGEFGAIVDAKSGVSGAGRGLKQGSLYCEVNEGLTPYNVGRHRHQPEMEQELTAAAGRRVRLTFAPHLVPLSRGMEATIYLEPPPGTGLREVGALLRESYAGEPFVKVLPDGKLPSVRDVAGTNLCRIGCTDDPQAGRVVVVSVIDNLVKGAAGQALQNMNLMLGLPETAGLEQPGLFP